MINFELLANNLPKGTATRVTRMDLSRITKIIVTLNTRGNWNHGYYVAINLQIWDVISYGRLRRCGHLRICMAPSFSLLKNFKSGHNLTLRDESCDFFLYMLRKKSKN